MQVAIPRYVPMVFKSAKDILRYRKILDTTSGVLGKNVYKKVEMREKGRVAVSLAKKTESISS